jgi:hypothetical protein
MSVGDGRRRPGEVRDAILECLRERGGTGSVSEILMAVRSRLGGDVPPSSVRSYLRLNEGTLFSRERRGHYKLVTR